MNGPFHISKFLNLDFFSYKWDSLLKLIYFQNTSPEVMQSWKISQANKLYGCLVLVLGI